jgi:hypothetical protein
MWILADFIKNIPLVLSQPKIVSLVPVVRNNIVARVYQCINPYTNYEYE